MEDIALAALRNDTPVFFDAEETWFQTWIDEQCEILMKRFNNEKAIVYTTLQLYRHDRLEYLHNLHAKGKVEGFIPAVKLVRGAYLEKENLRAQTLGYQTPMQANKGATDQDFNLALRFCLDHIDSIALCAGTHNEESCYLLTHLMKEKGIANDHPYIAFAQLYGMSDHISYNLGSEGYRVAKYLPYGPVKSVLPYLFRRAEENTSIKGQTGRELELIRKELKRRSGKV
jgi:proline dehydrogenase